MPQRLVVFLYGLKISNLLYGFNYTTSLSFVKWKTNGKPTGLPIQ
ncbi:MAG: hypothetical protein V1840_03655 [Candidatus Omnitrophota bacterium]